MYNLTSVWLQIIKDSDTQTFIFMILSLTISLFYKDTEEEKRIVKLAQIIAMCVIKEHG